jgi:hypothetical protein
MINLLFLRRELEKSALANVLKAGAGILSEAVDHQLVAARLRKFVRQPIASMALAVGIVGALSR